MEFRHEWKHEIGYSDLLALRCRLGAVMDRDAHATDGTYRIRSLYFDNLADRALREKIDGVNCREKFRIRYYNDDSSLLLLEKKSKVNGLCAKVQESLSQEDTIRILQGDLTNLTGSGKPLLQELHQKMITQGLRPRTIVEYIREPFVYQPGNVRVTLDYDIHVGMSWGDFLKPDCAAVPIRGRSIILEVKWDAFLPSAIRDIVQVPSTHTSAFSKYAACRVYG